MSIDFQIFLGDSLANIKPRFIQAFQELDFDIQVHPELDLLKGAVSENCWIKVISAPAFLPRVTNIPYLVGFGYAISAHDPKRLTEPDVPQSMDTCTYEILTTAPYDVSKGSYFIQALTSAVLAMVTNGSIYDLEDGETIGGKAKLLSLQNKLIDTEADKPRRMTIINDLIKQGPEANALIRHLLEWETEFDVGGYPFATWPLMDSVDKVYLEQPIATLIPPMELPIAK